MADFEQVENCISFAENEGYTEWAKGAEDELTLYRVRLSAAEQALSKIAYPARSDWLPGEWPEVIRRMQAIARAALAGREETGGG